MRINPRSFDQYLMHAISSRQKLLAGLSEHSNINAPNNWIGTTMDYTKRE